MSDVSTPHEYLLRKNDNGCEFCVSDYTHLIKNEDGITSNVYVDINAVLRDWCRMVDDAIFEKFADIKGYRKCSKCDIRKEYYKDMKGK